MLKSILWPCLHCNQALRPIAVWAAVWTVVVTGSALTTACVTPTASTPATPAAIPDNTNESAPPVPSTAVPFTVPTLPFASQPALTLPHPQAPSWQRIELNALPNWQNDNTLSAWPALQTSCKKLGAKTNWAAFCSAALQSTPASDDAARTLLTQHLHAYVQSDPAGNTVGTATAYFEPVYTAQLQRGGAYQWPLYAAPEPMTSLPRSQLTPASGAAHPSLTGKELAWLDNPIDPFLAQVQGSLRIQLADGSIKRLGFAGKNGLAYQSIANALIKQGVFTASQASMERIKAWASSKDVASVQSVLNTNPSFVFFKWLDLPSDLGPIGAYNVPLTAMRSVAVDTAYTPLGVPLWLETRSINGALNQLMVAQDVGSAIKGAARVDIYAGSGEAAGKLASAQKYPSKVWVLWPKP